jgi:prepilin-type N-terminal cleavage/methylation domain-containing protein
MTHTPPRAFSLLEVTVVTVILGVVAGVGIARAGNGGSEYRARLAAQRLASDLREAGRQSMYRSTTVTVVFDAASDSYTITGLYADGEVITVDLGVPPYRVDVTTLEVDGADTLTYSGGAPSSALPVTAVLDASTRVFEVSVDTVVTGSLADDFTLSGSALKAAAAALAQ